MGNTHAFSYRIPAIATAVFSSSGLALLALSGTTCSFLEIRAKEGHLLDVPGTVYPPVETSTYVGPICGNDLYRESLDGDLMYLLSRVCLFVALGLGSITCIIAWAISTYVGPTDANWKLLSVFAAVAAVIQMPVFLLFETEPCSGFPSDQECFLSQGSFLLIFSTILWVTVTLVTQCLDPPAWQEQLDAWRIKGHHSDRDGVQPSCPIPETDESIVDENDGGTESHAPLIKTPKERTFLLKFRHWTERRCWASGAELPKNETDSLSQDDEQYGPVQKQIAKYCEEEEDDSCKLVLKVLPNGRRPGDDSRSVQSFEDLDSFVQMAEEGKLTPVPMKHNESMEGRKWESNPEEQSDLAETLIVVEKVQQRLVAGIYNDLDEPQPIPDGPQVKSGATTTDHGNHQDPGDDFFNENLPASSKKKTKSSHVIKSLSENLKKRSRARKCSNNRYALMDDDDMEATYPVFPREVVFNRNESDILPEPDLPGTPTKQAEFNPDSVDAMHSRSSSSLDSEEYPDPIISSMDSISENSSEEKPDPIICSDSHDSDCDSNLEEDDYEFSILTRSLEAKSGPVLRRDTRPSTSKSHRHNKSPGCSTVSCRSLLETSITEETDDDLREFENECSDAAPYNLVRSTSEPTSFRKSHYVLRSSDPVRSILANELKGPRQYSFHADRYQIGLREIQLAPITSRCKSYDRGYLNVSSPTGETLNLDFLRREARRPRQGTNEIAPRSLSTSFNSEKEDPTEFMSFLSEPRWNSGALGASRSQRQRDPPVEDSTGEEESESTDTNSFEAEIMSWIEERQSQIYSSEKAGVSPVMTAPETPSSGIPSPENQRQDDEVLKGTNDLSISFDSEMSWKQERELRGGIHAVPIDSVGDDSSSSNNDGDGPGTLGRVREARIRRLTGAMNRRRARTLDPPSRNCPGTSLSSMSSVVDKLDLQLIEVLRPHGAEYGPEEVSL